MAKFKVTYYETFYSTVEIEANSPEEAEREFWWKWENDIDEGFVDDVIYNREVSNSEIEVE